MWELLWDGLQFLTTISRSRAAFAAEILFLRKQLAYYQDHQIRPRRLRDGLGIDSPKPSADIDPTKTGADSSGSPANRVSK